MRPSGSSEDLEQIRPPGNHAAPAWASLAWMNHIPGYQVSTIAKAAVISQRELLGDPGWFYARSNLLVPSGLEEWSAKANALAFSQLWPFCDTNGAP